MSTKASVAFVIAATLSLASIASAQTAPPVEYIRGMYAQIVKVTVYPKMAKLRGQEGKVGCLVKLDGKGGVVDSSVENSSGTTALDDAALDAIKNAAPFQPPPGGDAGATVHLVLNFSLNS